MSSEQMINLFKIVIFRSKLFKEQRVGGVFFWWDVIYEDTSKNHTQKRAILKRLI